MDHLVWQLTSVIDIFRAVFYRQSATKLVAKIGQCVSQIGYLAIHKPAMDGISMAVFLRRIPIDSCYVHPRGLFQSCWRASYLETLLTYKIRLARTSGNSRKNSKNGRKCIKIGGFRENTKLLPTCLANRFENRFEKTPHSLNKKPSPISSKQNGA